MKANRELAIISYVVIALTTSKLVDACIDTQIENSQLRAEIEMATHTCSSNELQFTINYGQNEFVDISISDNSIFANVIDSSVDVITNDDGSEIEVNISPQYALESISNTELNLIHRQVTLEYPEGEDNSEICDEYKCYVYEICQYYDNITPELILAVIETESRGIGDIVSDSGTYKGLMQINPRYQVDRMAKLGVTDIMDPRSNILVGTDMLSCMISDYNGNVALALMRYNGDSRAGEPGYISSYASTILARESQLITMHNSVEIKITDYVEE